MKEGHFTSPTRLTAAREFRGLTKLELAKRIGCTSMAISGYEKSTWRPGQEFLQAIAVALDFPVSWFLQDEINLVDSLAPTFRAQSRMTAGTRNRALRTWDFAALIAEKLRGEYNLPPVALPDLSEETPELAAHHLRDEWRLGNEPISNTVQLLESKGVMVFWTDIDSPSVDACCHWSDNYPIVLLNINERAGERLRFNIAHELGHLVLHREQSQSTATLVEVESTETLNEAPTEEKKELSDAQIREQQANRFASAFLMPRVAWQQVSPLQPRLEAFEDLKPHWKVSIQAMIRRSYDLKLISQWQYESAMTRVSINGWRQSEPGELPVEQSRLHRMVFELTKDSGVSLEEFAKSLHLQPSVVESLMPIASQFKAKAGRPDLRVVPQGTVLKFASGG